MMNDKIKKEKERLMKEVLNRKRTASFENVDAKLYLDGKNEAIHEANNVLKELNEILAKQKKDLEKMSNENYGEVDMNQLQKEIEKDFGVNLKVEEVAKNVSKTTFDDINNKLKEIIIGQDEAVNGINIAFRRPYVMKSNENKAQNVMIVRGKIGSGKHMLIKSMAALMYQKNILSSDIVYTIDMSLYNSSAQEHLFLQDLYMAIKGKGSIICFENFEVGYAPFLRMVNDLVIDGKMMLNKRYVVNKGQLIESQTGLVSEAVNSLSVDGKYLIFVTENKLSKVIDSFGASFMSHVNDIIELKDISDEILTKIINMKLQELVIKVKSNLNLIINISETVIKFIKKTYDKDNGLDSVDEIINDLYKQISEVKLNDLVSDYEELTIDVGDNKLYMHGQAKKFTLTKEVDDGLDEINKELDEVVGLKMVKDYIKSLQSHILVQKRRKQQGMKTTDVSKHMIFTGNPGTGKTTIARLISRYMKAIGALSQGQLVEVTRADLVGKYVGHTAPLTMQVIKSAIGGVLFIDEAYALYRGKDDSFGLEAIDTLVKAMEDYRDDLIVILAGYSKEMETFLESNSGLKSRFPNVINFPDYTGNELMEIALVIAKGKGYRISDEALKPLEEFFVEKQAGNSKENGNGRLARNVVEDAILKQSQRIINEDNPKMDLIEAIDFKFN